MTVDYKSLDKEEFDAIVTGELAHYAIWFEDELANFIVHLLGNPATGAIFKAAILERENFGFQAKIDVLRSIISALPQKNDSKPKSKINADELMDIIKEIETFKKLRNALAHGKDATPDTSDKNHIFIEVLSRNRKSKVYEITPKSHAAMMAHLEGLLAKLQALIKEAQVAGSNK